MSADRVQVTYGITAELEKRGCYKLFDIDEENEFWATPWGFSFSVPVSDSGLPTVMWMDILAQIETTRPK